MSTRNSPITSGHGSKNVHEISTLLADARRGWLKSSLLGPLLRLSEKARVHTMSAGAPAPAPSISQSCSWQLYHQCAPSLAALVRHCCQCKPPIVSFSKPFPKGQRRSKPAAIPVQNWCGLCVPKLSAQKDRASCVGHVATKSTASSRNRPRGGNMLAGRCTPLIECMCCTGSLGHATQN